MAKVRAVGDKEYSWVYRPKIPLLVEGFGSCDSWAADLANTRPLKNIGAFGPFVRLGLALRFGRALQGGSERLQELARLARASRFKQVIEKAFEFEAAYSFGGPGVRDDLEFGPLGGNPDLWLGKGAGRVPVECKVALGQGRPSAKCLGVWKRFQVWAVQEMKRLRVCAGVCVRAQDDFGPQSAASLRMLTAKLITDLSEAPDETWAVSPDATGTFLVYGYRLCEWGQPRPPFAVDFGLDGDVAVWVSYNPTQNVLGRAYFLALKFQAPELMASAVVHGFKAAAEQLARVHPDGPGLVVLKVNAPRLGDLLEIDRAVRTALPRRPQVSAALLTWDESHVHDDGAPTVQWGLTLKSYMIVNERARVRLAGLVDSRPGFFPDHPKAVQRAPSGELLPFDPEEERRILEAGITLSEADGSSPLLLNAKVHDIPRWPHIVQESSGLSEREGKTTFRWRFRAPLAEGLFQLPYDQVPLEWLVLGRTQVRIYRDRHQNLCVHRRSTGFQDNVAIDLIPFGRATVICLQVVWTPDELRAGIECLDGWQQVVCRGARSPLD